MHLLRQKRLTMRLKRKCEFRQDAVLIALTSRLTCNPKADGLDAEQMSMMLGGRTNYTSTVFRVAACAPKSRSLNVPTRTARRVYGCPCPVHTKGTYGDGPAIGNCRLRHQGRDRKVDHLSIVRAERDPKVLAAFRDVRCGSLMDTTKTAVVGDER